MKAPKMTKIPSEKKIIDKDNSVMKKGKVEHMERTIDPRPSFSVNAEILPQIKDWSVGKKYKIEIEAEMVGSRIEDWGDDKGKLVASFKISGIMQDTDDDKNDIDEI